MVATEGSEKRINTRVTLPLSWCCTTEESKDWTGNTHPAFFLDSIVATAFFFTLVLHNWKVERLDRQHTPSIFFFFLDSLVAPEK